MGGKCVLFGVYGETEIFADLYDVIWITDGRFGVEGMRTRTPVIPRFRPGRRGHFYFGDLAAEIVQGVAYAFRLVDCPA